MQIEGIVSSVPDTFSEEKPNASEKNIALTSIAVGKIVKSLESDFPLEGQKFEVVTKRNEFCEDCHCRDNPKMPSLNFKDERESLITLTLKALGGDDDGELLCSFPLVGSKNIQVLLEEMKERIASDSENLRFKMSNGEKVSSNAAKLFQEEDAFLQQLSLMHESSSQLRTMDDKMRFFEALKKAASSVETAREAC
jgi:hypothetical protein